MAAHQAPPSLGFSRQEHWSRVAISFSNAWKRKVKVKLLSRVRPSATPWTAAYQAPPPMGFSRQEYWSGLPLPSPIEGLVMANLAFLIVPQWLFSAPRLRALESALLFPLQKCRSGLVSPTWPSQPPHHWFPPSLLQLYSPAAPNCSQLQNALHSLTKICLAEQPPAQGWGSYPIPSSYWCYIPSTIEGSACAKHCSLYYIWFLFISHKLWVGCY